MTPIQKSSSTIFFINSTLDQLEILKVPVIYHTDLSHSQFRVLEGCLIFYEQIFFANKHICRIVVPFPLRQKNI